MKMFSAQLSASNNRPAGFDLLRLVLSIAVIAWHSCVLSYGRDFAYSLPVGYLVPVRMILVAFFALSGFLVAGSLVRCRSLVSFLGLRVIRIVPALAVEVIFSAVLIGSAMTTLPLTEYFLTSEFSIYFLNIFGIISYSLPGVFATNPFADVVNGQLWTIPWEFWCYFILALLALVRVPNKPWLFLGVCICLTGYVIFRGLSRPAGPLDFTPGPSLVISFMWGVVIYLLKDKIPHDRKLALGCFVAVVALLHFGKGNYFTPPFVAYLTMYLGALNFRKGKFLSSGDYSYGLYLYGFPVQQVLAARGGLGLVWIGNFGLTIAIGLVVAYLSWNFIELPTAGWRKWVVAFEENYLRLRTRAISKLV